jgi:hypothetical protein
MATSHLFQGQTVKIPGVKSAIKSGIKNPSIQSSFGTVLIIDTGLGAGYGVGSGVNGTLAKDQDTIYEFDNIGDFQSAMKGGMMYLLGSPLFRPAGLGTPGASKVSIIRAATTVPAEITYSFTGDNNGSESIVNGGTLAIQVRDEGLVGNGVELNSVLTRGFAAKMFRGINDTTKFVLKFYRGTFTGLDQNSLPYNNINEADTAPVLLAESPEFNNIQTLIDWMTNDYTFNVNFKLKTSVKTGTGEIDEADYLDYTTNRLAAGGTESYTSANLDNILTLIKNLDVSFILATEYGTNAQSANNYKIFSHIVNDSKFKPELYVAAGSTDSQFTLSKQTAVFYNNDVVTIVHGGVKKTSRYGSGFKTYDSIYKAAAILGREAGLQPQVPIAYKNIDIDGEVHVLSDKLVEQALDAGVVVTRMEDGTFDIVKGINSLQNNDFLVNEDGTISSKQIKRITRQLNKEIIIDARKELLKNPNGSNRMTLSALDVEKWLEKKLLSKTATPFADNLILSFQDITVVRQGDAYRINYSIVPNSEINFLFFTGALLDI